MRTLSIFLLLVTFLSWSCGEDDDPTPGQAQAEIDRQIIEDFISLNNLDAIEDPSGLFYLIEEPGGEEKPVVTDSITLEYTGFTPSGLFFDATEEDMPVTFLLDNLIEGWRIGIPKFGREGKGLLMIPSELGYGNNRVGVIPPNSVLVFDINLIDF